MTNRRSRQTRPRPINSAEESVYQSLMKIRLDFTSSSGFLFRFVPIFDTVGTTCGRSVWAGCILVYSRTYYKQARCVY
ncbi:MAG: hypothetical protein JKY96_01905 [Phycisphaerales bacterium]|nr:hypothetical protein [Phycisphaerales bacterium]